ncbi:MAG: RNA polymerase factor sigma-54 [Bacteroidales bacterium]|nr:RNA polymerase factor sigma-54 [Bacteroidales bacterium]
MGKQSLSQIQKLQQNLSPQQIQLMQLIQVPTMELAMRIKEEIETNPALEFDDNDSDEDNLNNDNVDTFDDEQGDDEHYDPLSDFDDYLNDDDEDDAAYKRYANNSSPDDEHYEAPISNETSFQDSLLEQLAFRKLDERKQKIGEYIIGNIDDSGYLSRPISGISDDLIFSQNIDVSDEEIREVLDVIKEFDPAGVGAENLRDCLLIQLKRLEDEDFEEDYENAINIIENFYTDFTQKHYDKIIAKSGMTEDELKTAIDQILKLNPKPGGTMSASSHSTNYVIPDFTVISNGDSLELSLNSRNTPDLHVSKDYKEMLAEYAKKKNTRENREAVAFIKNKIDSAKTFIDLINQRQNTLYVTMKAIMEKQHDFFITGDESKLKPMILKDIASVVGLDISTISRVANSKYVQTAFGTYKLKFFFSEGIMSDEGEEVSTRKIKQIIKECVDNEDKKNPLTDDELTAVLKEKGFTIARRTTAKYREQLEIPVSRLRKEL